MFTSMFDQVHLSRPNQLDTPGGDRINIDEVSTRTHGSDAQNCESKSNEVVLFGRSDEDAFGITISSPPLWKTSSNPHQNLLTYSQLSPAAKAQAVARGEQELMEMINNMPESSYELSLKDIVEYKHRQRRVEDQEGKIGEYNRKAEEMSKRKKAGGIMKSSGNVENGGFLLKLVLPFDFRSKEKKRIVLNESCKHGGCSKVSPRSSSGRGWDGLFLFGENDSIGRFIRSRSGRVGISRSSSSSRTNSNNNRESDGIFVTGCWPAFSSKKRQSDD